MKSQNYLSTYLESLEERLKRIEEKLDAIQEFKASTIATARLTSLIVSGILGFVSMVSSGILTYVITIKLNK